MEMLKNLIKSRHMWKKRISATLACIVVFVTVYAMVLPAITLDWDAAGQDDGIVMEGDNEGGEEDVFSDDVDEDFDALDDFQWPVILTWTSPLPEEETIEEDEAEAIVEEPDCSVTATVYEDSGLSGNAVLQVEEIEKGTEEYEYYLSSALAAVSSEDEAAVREISYARFFDITFIGEDGEPVEPTGPVSIVIDYMKETEEKEDAADGLEAPEEISVVHFDQKNGEEPVLMEIQTEEKDDQVQSVTFESDSFSVYGVVKTYTVDVSGEAQSGDENLKFTHSYSLLGGESILLSELLKTAWLEHENLQIEDVKEVTAGDHTAGKDTAEDRYMLKVIQDESAGDYEIAAPAGSEEDLAGQKGTLSVLFEDGSRAVFEITISGIPEVDAGLAVIKSSSGTYLPEAAEGSAEEIKREEISSSAEKIVEEGGSETVSRVFDISLNLTVEEQAAFEGGFLVDLTLPEKVTGRDFRLYHIHDGQTEELAIEKTGSVLDETGLETVSGIQFVTEGFSEFVLQYTVDFHYEANGKVYDFSIPGGGFVSLEHVVEVLGIATSDENTENGSENAENGAENGNDFVGEVPGVDVSGVNGEDSTDETADGETSPSADSTTYEEAIRLNEVEVSEATKKFMADVERVEFSSPELVWVGKVDVANKVGDLKEANGLNVEYSADLTEEQIAEINAQTVEAGDWALISLNPFESEETLTVTMKDGDVFTIRVTDAQISTNVLTADGKTYKITVTYDEEAEIPDGAWLAVDEIVEESDYQNYVTKTEETLGRSINDSSARFFDIRIMDSEGNKVQPAKDVTVEIRLLDTGIEDEMEVVHFEETSELMDVSRDEESLRFDTDGFSVFAVIVIEDEEGSYVFHGDGYTVTIAHTAEAELPLGTILTVEEIDSGTEDYLKCISQTWKSVNKEYFEEKEKRIQLDGDSSPLTDMELINVNTARFFNINFSLNGTEIEPKVPVLVDIEMEDGLKTNSESPIIGVSHFTGDEVELIEPIETKLDDDGNMVDIIYEQTSFSDVGPYVGEKGRDDILPGTKVTLPKRETTSANGIGVPKASKTLTDNDEDGTYTLKLNVTGAEIDLSATEVKKSNILIVMDRSSSMWNNYVTVYDEFTGQPQNGKNYYGTTGSDYFELSWYYDWGGNLHYYTGLFQEYTGTVYTRSSQDRRRLDDEQQALDQLITFLLGKNKPGETVTDLEGNEIPLDDVIEISVISFADHALEGETTEVNWSTDYDDLMEGVNNDNHPSGTNWEDAFKYAQRVADAKAEDPTQAGEDMYVIFLTDGEPTAIAGETGGAHHYDQTQNGQKVNWYNGNYRPGLWFGRHYQGEDNEIGGFEYALTGTGSFYSGFDDGMNAEDRAKLLADKYKFYGIFTYGEGADQLSYLQRLVNFAYGAGDNANSSTYLDNYFYDVSDANQLTAVFKEIFKEISKMQAHGQVKITDGLTAGAMTTTFVAGRPEGVRYTVTRDDGDDETEDEILYTVTATADPNNPGNTIVTFNIDGEEYSTAASDPERQVQLITNPAGSYDAGSYYMIKVGETEYKMALANIDSSHSNSVTSGLLTWDLSPIGTLWGGCTYTAEFIVWPNQAAYDYVAALNNKDSGYSVTDSNGIDWDERVEDDDHLVEDSNHNHYWTGGVAAYPSIVKYKDGPNAGKYAVLTNTSQNLDYSIVTQEGDNEPVVVPQPQVPLKTPDPMPLTKTQAKIEKIWNVENSVKELYSLLYGNIDDQTGKIIPFEIQFDVEQGGNKYTSVSLPGSEWDAEDQDYDWNGDKYYDASYMTEYNGKSFSTHWITDFAISTGLMLSKDEMVAIKLDPALYTSKQVFDKNGKDYYILESGHDYSIKEKENYELSYEFDFSEPSYHPMFVDGTLMDVTIENVEGVRTITKMEPIPVDDLGVSTLTAENTLRGYIHLKKHVVDKDGNHIDDNTEFVYDVTLENNKELFEGTHIPWYAVNHCFYHVREGDERYYYQVENEGGSNWSLTDENGKRYTFTDASYDKDLAEPQTISCRDEETGEPVEFTIYGNQMTAENNKKTTAVLYIRQGETLSIGNIPEGSRYTITEKTKDGYVLQKIENPDSADPQYADYNISISLDDAAITGIIIPNHDNNVDYTNKRIEADLDLYKVTKDSLGNETKVYLEGAEFTVTQLDESGLGNYKKDPETEALVFEKKVETDENGKAVLLRLQEGYYEIRETVAPAGYILTSEPDYFKVVDGVLTRLSKITENDETTEEDERLVVNWPENTDNTGMFRFSEAKSAIDDNPDTTEVESEPAEKANYVVGNEPGAALPNTGGPGTTALYLFGIILTAFAGAGLVMRKRKRDAA